MFVLSFLLCSDITSSVYVSKSYIYWSLGYYCSDGAASSTPSDGVTGDICPVEHYCPLGSSSPVVCPDGTYSNTTGIRISTASPTRIMIFSIKAGFSLLCSLFFSLNEGAEVCDDCPTGTYCLSGEGVQLCPAGHYCLGGGVEGILPCPPGTYSPQFGLSQVEQCLICPAGESIVIWLPPLLCLTLQSLSWTSLEMIFSGYFGN